MIKGVDISSWQRGLNVASLKEQGVDFAILKIGEGKTFVDPCFDEFYKAATAAGIAVGAYFYSYATTVEQGIADAKRALALANGISLPLGIYIDVEDPAQMKLRDSELTAVVSAFCDTIRAGGYIPGAYGSLGNLWAKVGPKYVGDDVMVWVAAWSNSPPSMGDVWQYSDKQHFNGWSGNVDGDQALSERFELLVNHGSVIVPTPEPVDLVVEGTFTLEIPVLRKGDINNAVKAMQGELIALGYRCGGKRAICGHETADGIFGNVTEASVRSFQRSRNLPDTGVMDKTTRDALICKR